MRKPPYFWAWLVFFLIATVGGFVVGAIAGMFLGVALAVAKAPPETIKVAATVLGFVLSVPISYFTFRWVVSAMIVGKMAAEPPVIGAEPKREAQPPAEEPLGP